MLPPRIRCVRTTFSLGRVITPKHLFSSTKKSRHFSASTTSLETPVEHKLPSFHHEELGVVLKVAGVDVHNVSSRLRDTLKIVDLPAPHAGHIRILLLNRPGARNAISKQLLSDLDAELSAIYSEEDKPSTRALIIASVTDSAFCAGADLRERREMSDDEVSKFLISLRATFSRLALLPIPCIASVAGPALGGGLELALCAHIRLISSQAVVAMPETRLGIIPGAGGTYRLPTIIGQAAALDLILTGRRLTGREAAALGLGNLVDTQTEDMPNEISDPTGRKLCLARSIGVATQIGLGGPLAVKAVLKAMASKEESEESENMAYESLLHTRDRKEALNAFAEKRRARFTGE